MEENRKRLLRGAGSRRHILAMKHDIGQEIGDDIATALDEDSPITFRQQVVDEARGGPIQIPMVGITAILILELSESDIHLSSLCSWVANTVL